MTEPACNIRLAILSITCLAGLCATLGAFLLWKGYSGGDVLVSTAATAVGGLVGMISMRNAPPPPPPNTSQVVTTTTKNDPKP